MLISELTIKDYNEAYDLWNRTEGMGMRSLDDSEAGIQRFLLRNPNTNFVCRVNGEMVGLILCGHDGRRAYIYHAVVAKEHRSKGIGKRLLNSVIDAVRNEGINKIALVVFEDNLLGNGFWEAQGFIKRDDLSYRNRSINELNI